jgi:hypothetical protein
MNDLHCMILCQLTRLFLHFSVFFGTRLSKISRAFYFTVILHVEKFLWTDRIQCSIRLFIDKVLLWIQKMCLRHFPDYKIKKFIVFFKMHFWNILYVTAHLIFIYLLCIIVGITEVRVFYCVVIDISLC